MKETTVSWSSNKRETLLQEKKKKELGHMNRNEKKKLRFEKSEKHLMGAFCLWV